MEGEHRALDDTRLSIELFLLFLEKLASLEAPTFSFWKKNQIKDRSHTLTFLVDLIEAS
jgi:hypothetical protein